MSCSLDDLKTALEEWIKVWNDDARPFRWTKTADQILDRICRYCDRISEPVTRTGFRGWLTRHQAWLFFPLTLLEGLALKLHGLQDLRRQTGRERLVEGTLLVALVAGCVTSS